MKILHVINDSDIGGAQTLIEALASRRRSEDEVRAIVLMGRASLAPRLDAAFDRVLYLNLSKSSTTVVPAVAGLARAVRAWRPDVVHSHLLQADLVTSLAPKGRAAHVSTVHTTGLSSSDPARSRLIARAVGLLSRRVEGLVTVHPTCDAFLRENRFRAPDAVITNGVVVPDGEVPARTGEVLLSLARWHPMKGHGDLFAAFAQTLRRHPGATLVCAGSGMSEDNLVLVDMLRAAGLRTGPGSSVRLEGAVEEPARLLAEADCLVVSSTYGEAAPMVTLEACAAGLPVIATRVGGAPDGVVDHRLVVPPGAPAALAGAVDHLLGLDDDARRSLGRASRERAVDQFSIDSRVARYGEVYTVAVRRASARRSARALR